MITHRYTRTRRRVHRVVVEDGRIYKVENCNLDDVHTLRLQDDVPPGPRCAHCWANEDTPDGG